MEVYMEVYLDWRWSYRMELSGTVLASFGKTTLVSITISARHEC
jgi:hypothetical protein